MRNSEFNHSDVKKVCEKKLSIEFTSAKEYNGWYLMNGVKNKRITVSKGRKFITPGVYGSMAKQLGLTISDFDRMLECTLTRAAYDKMMGK